MNINFEHVEKLLTAIKCNTIEKYDEHYNYAPYVQIQYIQEEIENIKNIIKEGLSEHEY